MTRHRYINQGTFQGTFITLSCGLKPGCTMNSPGKKPMRYFLSVSARAGHACCVTTMAVLFGLMQFSSGHAQARPAERSANPAKVLVSEQMRVPHWLADTAVRAAQATTTDPAVLMA